MSLEDCTNSVVEEESLISTTEEEANVTEDVVGVMAEEESVEEDFSDDGWIEKEDALDKVLSQRGAVPSLRDLSGDADELVDMTASCETITGMIYNADEDVNAAETCSYSLQPLLQMHESDRTCDVDATNHGPITTGEPSRPYHASASTRSASSEYIVVHAYKIDFISEFSACGELLTSDEGQVRYQCAFCSLSFAIITDLRIHERVHHSPKLYQCRYCEKTFREAATWKKHTRIHTGEKPYQCGSCEEEFRTSWSLKLHEMDHTGERPHRCSYCEESFKTKWDLTKHTRVHKVEQEILPNEKPYQCQYCEKTFGQAILWRQHTRIHMSDKPYHCEFCGDMFSTGRSLKLHKMDHAGEMVHQCSQCVKAFKMKRQLTRHRRQVH